MKNEKFFWLAAEANQRFALRFFIASHTYCQHIVKADIMRPSIAFHKRLLQTATAPLVGLPSKPSPAGKGDREAVDEENILRWPRVTDIQLYRAMHHALLLHPLAPSTTSWSPSLPEGGNQAIGTGVCPFVKDLLQCVEICTAAVLFSLCR